MRIVLQPAVVLQVQNAVIVRVRITLVAGAVLVHVMLVRVRRVRTIVHRVRNAVPVPIVVRVAHVAERVLVHIGLIGVADLGTVVASVAEAVAVAVLLVLVGRERTVVPFVEDAVVVLVRVAGVAQAVLVRVLLVQVGQEGTVVARIAAIVRP